MTFALAFWVLMLIWLVFGVYRWSDFGVPGILQFLLFGLLGWKVFGPALH